MIQIRSTQRSFRIKSAQLKRDCARILSCLGYPDFSCSIWFTTNATIRRYNRLFRKVDKPTDILSFPYHPELKAGERITVSDAEDRTLGDLIISAEYVAKTASELGVSFHDHARRLIVHGMCHLLNYDHMNAADFNQMNTLERLLLKELGAVDTVGNYFEWE